MSLQPNNDKELINLFDEFGRVLFDNLNSAKIGMINSFDTSNQTAEISVMHKKVDPNSTTERILINYPVLRDVPCFILGGGGTYTSYPISSGDFCLVFFNDFMIDNWWTTGENNPSDFPRMHDLSDGFALVGLRWSGNVISDFSEFLKLHYSDDSNIIIGDEIDITNSQTNISENLDVGGDVQIDGNTNIDQSLTVGIDVTAPKLNATTAATGVFRSADNKNITVVNGIVTVIA